MENGAAKTLTLWAALIIAVALGIFFFRGGAPSVGGASGGGEDGARAEVLHLAERGRALGDTDKKRLFELLSGERFREYRFSDRERALILKAIGG